MVTIFLSTVLYRFNYNYLMPHVFLLFRASRLGREHHDDLAQFLLGMGYATEALHLPGISKRYAITTLAPLCV